MIASGMIEDPGNCHAGGLNPGEALSRLGKHQVQVLARDIVRRARDESRCVQPVPGSHMEIAERSQSRLRFPGRGANARIVPEQYVPVDGALA
jgi:hypothetical protein